MTWAVWAVEFEAPCHEDIRLAGLETSHNVCTAVVEFAKTGSGVVEQDEDGSTSRRIRARGGYALVYFDAYQRRIYVSRIIAYNPPPRVVPLLDAPIHDEPSED
jgi:hypothetical protein